MRNLAYISILVGFVCLVTAKRNNSSEERIRTEAEMKGKLFVKLLDADSDTKIDPKEFSLLSETSLADVKKKLKMDEERMNRMKELYDSDKDGNWNTAEVNEVFPKLDLDRSGSVDEAEAIQHMRSLFGSTKREKRSKGDKGKVVKETGKVKRQEKEQGKGEQEKEEMDKGKEGQKKGGNDKDNKVKGKKEKEVKGKEKIQEIEQEKGEQEKEEMDKGKKKGENYKDKKE